MYVYDCRTYEKGGRTIQSLTAHMVNANMIDELRQFLRCLASPSPSPPLPPSLSLSLSLSLSFSLSLSLSSICSVYLSTLRVDIQNVFSASRLLNHQTLRVLLFTLTHSVTMKTLYSQVYELL